MKENMVVIRDPKNFSFEKELKYGIELIIKIKESLTEIKIKNDIEQLLSKYKHRNNIHEHGKHQNE